MARYFLETDRIEPSIVGEVISGVQSGKQITKLFTISPKDSLNFSFDAKFGSAATKNGGSTIFRINLKTSFDGGTTWISHTGADIANAATTVSFDLNIEAAADQAYLPLRPLAKLEVESDHAGNSVTISNLYISRRD